MCFFLKLFIFLTTMTLCRLSVIPSRSVNRIPQTKNGIFIFHHLQNDSSLHMFWSSIKHLYTKSDAQLIFWVQSGVCVCVDVNVYICVHVSTHAYHTQHLDVMTVSTTCNWSIRDPCFIYCSSKFALGKLSLLLMLSYPLHIFPSYAHLEGVIKNGKYRRRPKTQETSHSTGPFKEKQLITPATTKSPNYEKTPTCTHFCR